jgi:hypothetical protein
MTVSMLVTLIVVLGIVCGGFIFFLARALRYEKLKLKNGKE